MQNNAVSHSNVNMTWDEDVKNPTIEKLYKLTNGKEVNEELDDDELRNLIASDSDEDDDDVLEDKAERFEQLEKKSRKSDPFRSFKDK